VRAIRHSPFKGYVPVSSLVPQYNARNARHPLIQGSSSYYNTTPIDSASDYIEQGHHMMIPETFLNTRASSSSIVSVQKEIILGSGNKQNDY
jgi:hypothetical protein